MSLAHGHFWHQLGPPRDESNRRRHDLVKNRSTSFCVETREKIKDLRAAELRTERSSELRETPVGTTSAAVNSAAVRPLVATFFASALVASSVDAQSFRTAADLPEFDDDARIAWADDVVTFRVAGAPSGVPVTVVLEEVVASASTWNRVSCASVRVEIDPTPHDRAVPGDGVNTIEFVTEGWGDRGLDANAAATTDVAFLSRPGEVVIGEADLVLNADSFRWGVEPAASGVRDIQAVVTHELGHALGIRHPCEPSGDEGAPRCTRDYEESALYPIYLGTTQRVLAPLDRDALCFLYPHPVACECDAPFECDRSGSCRRRCGDDVDCASGSCSAGLCGVEHAPGDPCEGSCTGELVCAVGTCAARCDGSCPRGFTCDGGACQSTRSAFGAECSHGRECASSLCVLVDDSGTCSRGCSELPCPESARCEVVEEQAVCVPKARGGGCSTGGSPAGSTAIFLAGLLLSSRRRKR